MFYLRKSEFDYLATRGVYPLIGKDEVTGLHWCMYFDTGGSVRGTTKDTFISACKSEGLNIDKIVVDDSKVCL